MPPIISAIKIRAFSIVIYSMPKMDALNINNPKTRSAAPINITPNSFTQLRSSRPRELPPQALTEPYVKLSLHTALHVPYKLPSLHNL